jgi:hypothetical protein
MKLCWACRTTKPLTDFREAKGYRLGVFPFCKQCEEHIKKVEASTNKALGFN